MKKILMSILLTFSIATFVFLDTYAGIYELGFLAQFYYVFIILAHGGLLILDHSKLPETSKFECALTAISVLVLVICGWLFTASLITFITLMRFVITSDKQTEPK